jgi:hypothetical protein
MESIKYIEITGPEDVEKYIEFCRMYGVIPGEDLKLYSL